MKDSNTKRAKRFSIISIIFIVFCLIIFGCAIIPDIIVYIYMMKQNGMTAGELVNIIFYVPIVLFVILFVFLAKRELKRHERDAELADKIASEYEKTESDDIENK